MEKVIQLLNGSICELHKLEEEIDKLNEEDFDRISSTYPFNHYFHEVVTSLKQWKKELEKS